ncbi:unnamed protein product [Dicrocoelium dendriticum]|nr:unnamed protein product [Dicrocoelium dendriticum]
MEADPSVLLEWLDSKNSDLQLTALDQLCVEILFSDNVDVFCERFPPLCFMPVLCRIFMDDQVPPAVLEANARAVSYYLDMHLEWCRYLTQSDEVISALASHLECVDMSSNKSNEFGQQLIKLMKIICSQDSKCLYANGGLTAVLHFIQSNASLLHTDVLRAGMDLIRRLFSKANPNDGTLATWMQSLRALMDCREPGVADQTLRAFANLVSRFAQTGADPSPIADPHIIDCLLRRLRVAGGVEAVSHSSEPGTMTSSSSTPSDHIGTGDLHSSRDLSLNSECNPLVVHAITNILITLCCTSTTLTQKLLTTDGQFATTLAMVMQRSDDEAVVLSVLRLINVLLVLLYQSPSADAPSLPTSQPPDDAQEDGATGLRAQSLSLPKSPIVSEGISLKTLTENIPDMTSQTVDEYASDKDTRSGCQNRDLLHRPVIEAIKRQDLDFLRSVLASGSIDANYTDHLGQTLLNWAASFGTPAIVELLCSHGGNVHHGVRSALDYAATFGRVEVCRALLSLGADPNLRDDQGLRPIDRARNHLPYPGCQQVIDLLESEMKRTDRVVTSPTRPDSSKMPMDPDSVGPASHTFKDNASGFAAQNVFLDRLFPVIVNLFDDNTSSTVRRQCILLVRRMIIFAHLDQLEKISAMSVRSLPFSFLLTQFIYNVFVQEVEEFVLHTLELTHCLLLKLPQIYTPVFYRFGLLPLIKQLCDVWTYLLPEPADLSLPPTPIIRVKASPLKSSDTMKEPSPSGAADSQVESAASVSEARSLLASSKQLRKNQLYTWHSWYMIWIGDLLSVFNRWAFVSIQLQSDDGRLRALAVHSGGNGDRIPILLQPGEAPVSRPGLKRHMLRLHEHLIEVSERLEEIALWSSRTENPEPPNPEAPCTKFDERIPRSISKKSQISRSNWRRVGKHLGLRRPPDHPYASKSRDANTSKAMLQRQASSPARACISARSFPTSFTLNGNDMFDVLTVSPVYCTLRRGIRSSRLCVQLHDPNTVKSQTSEPDTAIREALLFSEDADQGFSRVRIYPLYHEPGTLVQQEDTSRRIAHHKPTDPPPGQMETTSRRLYDRAQSGSLLTLMSQLDSELRSDDSGTLTEAPDCESNVPELYDFDVLFGVHDWDTCGEVTNDSESNRRFPLLGSPDALILTAEVTSELRRLNEILFPRELVYETFSTGPLSNWLRVDSECLASEEKDQRERERHQLYSVRYQALKLSKRILWLLKTGPNSSIKSDPCCTFKILRAIVADVWRAFDGDILSQSSKTLDLLSNAFAQMASLLASGEQSMTAYELSVSGLVPALLLCLSADQAGRWNCPTIPAGLDVMTASLWYLHERRRVFARHFLHGPGLTCLSRLSRRLVQTFEMVEHLPLRLFSLASGMSDKNSRPDPSASLQTPNTSVEDVRPFRYEDFVLAGFPLGVIRSVNTSHVERRSSSVTSLGLNEAHLFADCLDATEVAALTTFCSQLIVPDDNAMKQLEGRISVTLQKLPHASSTLESDNLIDWSNTNLRVNPLATCAQIESFLFKMSAKQWYDNPRTSLCHWLQLDQQGDRGITFPAPPETNSTNASDSLGGVIDWLATNGGCLPIEDWVNPALIGLVSVASSMGSQPACLLGPRAGALIGGYPVRCMGIGTFAKPRRTCNANRSDEGGQSIKGKCGPRDDGASNHSEKAWLAIDLGLQLQPTAYSLAYLRQAEARSSPLAPRNWNLEASNDGISWTVLRSHVDDTSIQSVSDSRATWSLESAPKPSPPVVLDSNRTSRTVHSDRITQGWRFFKIQATGPNACGTGELALGGLEFYGTVLVLHESVLSSSVLASRVHRKAKTPPSVSSPPRAPLVQLSSGIDDLRHFYHIDPSCVPEAELNQEREAADSDSSCAQASTSPHGLSSALRAVRNIFRSNQASSKSSTESSEESNELEQQKSREDQTSSPTRWLEGLGILNDNEPLLHYLLLSSGSESSENIRRLLRDIRKQPLRADSLSRSSSTGKSDPNPIAFPELKFGRQPSQADAEGAPSVLVTDSSADATSQAPKGASVPLESDEPVDDGRLTAPSVRVEESGRIEMPLWLLSREDSPTSCHGGQPAGGSFQSNTEDSAAMEFAETVEAIIQSNISSHSPPFSRAFSPTIQDPYEHLRESSRTDLTELEAYLQKVRNEKLNQDLIQQQPSQSRAGNTATWTKQECDAQDASYDSGLKTETVTNPFVTINVDNAKNSSDVPASLNRTDDSGGTDRTILRQHSINSCLDSKKTLHFKSVHKNQGKSSSSPGPPKGTRQRRRPRRPRSRPIQPENEPQLFTLPSVSDSKPATRIMPLSWNAAMETLRLPTGLIPSFNPTPGVTNAPATTMFTLCNPFPLSTSRNASTLHSVPSTGTRHRLMLQLSALINSHRVIEIAMTDPSRTLFSYIQELTQALQITRSHTKQHISEDTQAVMTDGPYTIELGYQMCGYEEESASLHKCCQSGFNPGAFVDHSDMRFTPSLRHPVKYSADVLSYVTMAEDQGSLDSVFTQQDEFNTSLTQPPPAPEHLLRLIKIIHQLSGISDPRLLTADFDDFTNQGLSQSLRTDPSGALHCVQHEDFISSRLTKKLLRQIHDPLALASGALPHWCFSLTHRLTPLFTFASRLDLLRACGFGPARAVLWLQNQSTKLGSPNVTLTRSQSVGSSASSGHHTATRSITVATAHTLALSSLLNTADDNAASDLPPTDRVTILTHTMGSSTAEENRTNAETSFLDSFGSSVGLHLPQELSDECSYDNLSRCILNRMLRNQVVQPDNKTLGQIARLHKEFVRVPRLPQELLVDSSDRMGGQISSEKRGSAVLPNFSFPVTFWDWAARLMEQHANRKSELEIQFVGENGTGLGPTLEFYSLLAAELRRRDGMMWVVDDSSIADQSAHDLSTIPTLASLSAQEDYRHSNFGPSPEDDMDLGIEASAYVNTPHGLFPAPWPPDRLPDGVLYRFYILGITVAKCLQDNRRIDLPLSPPLLKLLCSYGRNFALNRDDKELGGLESAVDQLIDGHSEPNRRTSREDGDFGSVSAAEEMLVKIPIFTEDNEDPASMIGELLVSSYYRRLYDAGTCRSIPPKHWLSELLNFDDFCIVYPERAPFFRRIVQFCRRKRLLTTQAGPHHVDVNTLKELAVEIFGCTLEDMVISMEFLPPSKEFGNTTFPLRDVYDWELSSMGTIKAPTAFSCRDSDWQSTEPELVTVHNIELYFTRTLAFYMDKGIRKQMDAFRDGFEKVLPLSWLALFTETELGQLIAGDSVTQWTREDLLAYTVPCFGFTHQSPTYQMLINILSNFDLLERRAFLQFTTGCSSLPPGGLKNLQPRLRVVRKELGTGAFPSVNTCVHYLKLPEYQSEDELRSVLLRATKEIGFYLN